MLAAFATAAYAAGSSTGTLNVTATVNDDCKVTNTPTLAFGTVGVFTANIDPAGVAINVQCTKTTAYNVALDAGAHDGGSGINNRHMSAGGADAIAYQLYRDAGRTQVWGVTVATDTVSGTGNGSDIAATVYGRIPPQASVTPGAYTDVVTITVSW